MDGPRSSTGLYVEDGRLEVDNTSVSEADGRGLVVAGVGTARLRRSGVGYVFGHPDIELGAVIHVSGLGRLELVDSGIYASPVAAAIAYGVGSTIEGRGLSVVGTAPGVAAVAGGEVVLRDSAIQQCSVAGLMAIFNARLDAQDTYVGDTTTGNSPDAIPGRGLQSELSDVRLVGTALVRNQHSGIAAPLSDLHLERSLVADTRATGGPGLAGYGVVVGSAGWAHVIDSAVVGNREAGVFVSGDGSIAWGQGGLLADTRPTLADGAFGTGLTAEYGGRIVWSDGVVAGNRGAGVWAYGRYTRVELQRMLVADTTSDDADALRGNGLLFEADSELRLRDSAVVASEMSGLLAIGRAKAVVTGSALLDSKARAPGFGVRFGDGVLAASYADVALLDTVVRRSERAGIA